jgi:ferredoxin
LTTLEIFEERCIGAGNCAEVAGKYFGLKDTDGTVALLRAELDPGDEALVERAVNICPVGAIAMTSVAGHAR